MLPEGLLTHELALFRSRTFRVEDGVAYDRSGRYAALDEFCYAGP